MVQIGILEPTDFSPRALGILRGVGEVSVFQGGDRSSFLKDKEVVFVRLAQRVDVSFLSECHDSGRKNRVSAGDNSI
jgi:hypothetical protein